MLRREEGRNGRAWRILLVHPPGQGRRGSCQHGPGFSVDDREWRSCLQGGRDSVGEPGPMGDPAVDDERGISELIPRRDQWLELVVASRVGRGDEGNSSSNAGAYLWMSWCSALVGRVSADKKEPPSFQIGAEMQPPPSKRPSHRRRAAADPRTGSRDQDEAIVG